MDLKRMRYFCSVVEQGSISKAARHLNMAQPPLSQRLKELEEDVGAPLLFRTERGVDVTELGHFLYKRSSDILRRVDDMRREASVIGHKEPHVLRIGLSYLYQGYFAGIISSICKSNSKIELSIYNSDSSHLEMLLKLGRIDIALIQRPERNDLYEVVKFAPVKMVAVISKALLAEPPASPISFRDLSQMPLALLRRIDGTGTYEAIRAEFNRIDVAPNVLMHVSEPRVMLDVLESGAPLASLLPESEVRAENLRSCHVAEIDRSPDIFFPGVVRLSSHSGLPDLDSILRHCRHVPVID